LAKQQKTQQQIHILVFNFLVDFTYNTWHDWTRDIWCECF